MRKNKLGIRKVVLMKRRRTGTVEKFMGKYGTKK
jgi:hypothetical protein